MLINQNHIGNGEEREMYTLKTELYKNRAKNIRQYKESFKYGNHE